MVYSVAELAKALNVSPAYIYPWMRGKSSPNARKHIVPLKTFERHNIKFVSADAFVAFVVANGMKRYLLRAIDNKHIMKAYNKQYGKLHLKLHANGSIEVV